MRISKKLSLLSAPALVLVVLAFAAPPAFANVPVFSITTISLPTNLPPGGEGRLLLEVHNLGGAPAVGETSPIVIADKLPAGLTATAISGAECELATLRCEYRETLRPYREIQLEITVKAEVKVGAGLVNEVNVSGGGAASTVALDHLMVSPTQASFGVESLQLSPNNEDGSVDTQAGSHPFQLTATLEVNNSLQPDSGNKNKLVVQPAGLSKDLHFDLPAGLVGNPQVIPQCTSKEFDALLQHEFNGCPAETAIGEATASLGYGSTGPFTVTVPLFNLVPSVGEPARFGFTIFNVPVILDTSVRTGGDYGVVVSVNNLSNTFAFFGAQVTFWGVPADSRHNSVRGWSCLYDNFYYEPGGEAYGPCVAPANSKLTPFLTLPTSCTGPAGMRTMVEADSWSEPGKFTEPYASPLSEGKGEPLRAGWLQPAAVRPVDQRRPGRSGGEFPDRVDDGRADPAGRGSEPRGDRSLRGEGRHRRAA